MTAFAGQGAVEIPPSARVAMRELFRGAMVSEEETARTMVATHNTTGELIDPHTAVGLAAAQRVGAARPSQPMVVLSTAHPAKFPETVKAATGAEPPIPPQVLALRKKRERIQRVPNDLQAVKSVVREVMGV